jgi:hypothetical protein
MGITVWSVDAGDLYWFSSKDEAKKFANQLYEEDLNGPIPFLATHEILDAEHLVQLLEK